MDDSRRTSRNRSRSRNADGDVQLACNVPQVLDVNLEVYCLQNRVSKKEVIVKAIGEFLKEAGMDPSKQPRINFQYDQET